MWLVAKEVWHFLTGDGQGKVKIKGFAGTLQAAYWLTLAFVLYVSIPHAVSVLEHYEPGGNTLNAVSLALAIELVPALAFLVATEFEGLGGWTRAGLVILALPFVGLSFVIQSEAFDLAGRHGIESWALALALPYGVIVTSIGIAIITGQIAKNREKIVQDIAAAVEAAKAELQTVIAGLQTRLTAIERDRDRLAALVAQKDALLAAPDPLAIMRENELAQAHQDLEAVRRELAETRAEAKADLERFYGELDTERRRNTDLATRLAQTETRAQEPEQTTRQLVSPTVVAPRLAVVPPQQGDKGAEVRALKETGLTWQQVADQMGKSVRTVQMWAAAANE